MAFWFAIFSFYPLFSPVLSAQTRKIKITSIKLFKRVLKLIFPMCLLQIPKKLDRPWTSNWAGGKGFPFIFTCFCRKELYSKQYFLCECMHHSYQFQQFCKHTGRRIYPQVLTFGSTENPMSIIPYHFQKEFYITARMQQHIAIPRQENEPHTTETQNSCRILLHFKDYRFLYKVFTVQKSVLIITTCVLVPLTVSY